MMAVSDATQPIKDKKRQSAPSTGASMSSLSTYVLAGVALVLDKERLKRKFEDFWLSVAELGTTASVGKAIRSRYEYMKRNIPLFLLIYWLFLLLMFTIVCFENYEMDASDIRNDFAQSVTGDFTFLANARYLEAAKDIKLFCLHRTDDCEKYGDELAWRKDVSRIANLESSYDDLLDELSKNPFWFRLAADASAALVIILIAIPLSLSLLVSFNLTLWLLSRTTSSSLKLIAIIGLDIFIAVIMPVVLLSLFMLIYTYVSVIAIGGFMDFTYFDTVNITTLIVGQSAILINLSLLFLAGPAWFVYAVADWGVRIFYLIVQMLALAGFMRFTIVNFIGDTWKVAHFDFSTAYTDGVINFAITTDLLYSLMFLLPGLGILLLHRWPFGQRTFLNIIQWFAEHPRGPYYAISRMFLGLASAAGKMAWRRLKLPNLRQAFSMAPRGLS
jgi:hypothetical protein